MSNVPRVMISSTVHDLESYRDAAKTACLKVGMFPSMMEYLPPSSRDAKQLSEELVDQANVYLAIVGMCYGNTDDATGLSYVELEYNRAVCRGIPRLIFLSGDDCRFDNSHLPPEPTDRQGKIVAFRRRLKGEVYLQWFNNPSELQAQAIHGLYEEILGVNPGSAIPAPDPEEEQLLKLAAMNDSSLYDFLEWYHGVELWKCHGFKFPVAVWPIAPAHQQNGMSFLTFDGPEELKHESAGFPQSLYDGELVAKRRRQNRGMINNPTYCLRSFDPTRTKVVSGLIGRYFDAVATCDSLEEELLLAWGRHRPGGAEGWRHFSENHLPRRQQLKLLCEAEGLAPYLSGKFRSAAIAVATLTVCRVMDKSKRIDEFRAFLRARSNWVANHPNMLHVIPSGMFQPTRDWDLEEPSGAAECRNEWDLEHHVYREFAEELFSLEPERVEGGWWDRFYGLDEVKYLRLLMKETTPRAELLTTAIMVNMLNLRLEICTLLLITDSEWFLRHTQGDGARRIVFNQEFMSDEELQASKQPRLRYVRIWEHGHSIAARDIVATSLGGNASPGRFVPPGAVALWMGIEAAQRRINELMDAGRIC